MKLPLAFLVIAILVVCRSALATTPCLSAALALLASAAASTTNGSEEAQHTAAGESVDAPGDTDTDVEKQKKFLDQMARVANKDGSEGEEADDAETVRQRTIDAAIGAVKQCFWSMTSPRVSARPLPTAIFPHKGIDPIVEFDDGVDAIDVEYIIAMTHCVRKLQPDHYEDRPFDQGLSGYGGGNNVTYLGGFVEAIIPELAHHILDVAAATTEKAGWYPHPRHLGYRCIELLEYDVGGELLMHQDADSVYTMVFMLGDPEDFEGGQFVIQPRAWDTRLQSPRSQSEIGRMSPVVAEPNMYGGILFDSLADHAVTPVSSGKRMVLAVELWPFGHVDITGMRPHARYYKHSVQRPYIFSNRISETAHRATPATDTSAGSGTSPNKQTNTHSRPSPSTSLSNPLSIWAAAQRALYAVIPGPEAHSFFPPPEQSTPDVATHVRELELYASRQFYAGLCFGLAAGILLLVVVGEDGRGGKNEIPLTMRAGAALLKPARGPLAAGAAAAAAAANGSGGVGKGLGSLSGLVAAGSSLFGDLSSAAASAAAASAAASSAPGSGQSVAGSVSSASDKGSPGPASPRKTKGGKGGKKD